MTLRAPFSSEISGSVVLSVSALSWRTKKVPHASSPPAVACTQLSSGESQVVRTLYTMTIVSSGPRSVSMRVWVMLSPGRFSPQYSKVEVVPVVTRGSKGTSVRSGIGLPDLSSTVIRVEPLT